MESSQLGPSQSRRSESDKEKCSINNVAISSLEANDSRDVVTLPPPPSLTPEQELALYRKIDRRVMVLSTLSIMLPFSDRSEFLSRLCT